MCFLITFKITDTTDNGRTAKTIYFDQHCVCVSVCVCVCVCVFVCVCVVSVSIQDAHTSYQIHNDEEKEKERENEGGNKRGGRKDGILHSRTWLLDSLRLSLRLSFEHLVILSLHHSNSIKIASR